MNKLVATSEAEIQYLIPGQSRLLGDVETILNAVGAFQYDQKFPVNQRYQAMAKEAVGGSAYIRLVKTELAVLAHSELLEATERMRRGVEDHFPEDDKQRLTRHFVGIALRGAFENE